MPARKRPPNATTVRFDKDLLRRLDRIARRDCTSRASVIKRYLLNGLKREERKHGEPETDDVLG